MSNMIGVGNLALPHALYQAGLILGIIFLTTGALLGIWSNNCLTTVAFKKNLGKYSDVVDAVLGKVYYNLFFDL
jgi:amino acid permease